MAIYHLHVGIIGRSTGRSAVAAAAYRAAEKLHNEHDGLTHDYAERSSAVNAAAYRSGEVLHNEQHGATHDYTRKMGVVHTEIMLPNNAPKAFEDRATLWNAVEKSEKRRDAQTARDLDIALPVELERHEHFVSRGMCADFAIHDKGDGNPHAHIILTMRDVSAVGFGKKNREWNRPEYLKQWRESWADICNSKLHEKGIDERIDNRTLEAQGIDREPTTHRGVAVESMNRKGMNTKIFQQHRELVERNQAKAQSPEATAAYIHKLKNEYIALDKEATDLQQEAVKARREMEALHFKAEDVLKQAADISSMAKELEKLRLEREQMSFFKSKKLKLRI